MNHHPDRPAAVLAAPAANPWLPRPAATAVADNPGRRPVPADGPLVPQPATVTAPGPDVRLPVRADTATAVLWLVGCHGGAGETTLAALGADRGWRAAGHAWPGPASGPARVVLVARTDRAGLAAARAAATCWAAGLYPNVDLLGLVLTADARGRLPRALREQAALVAGAVPRTWRLPFIDAWRLAPPDPTDPPPAVRRLAADLDLLTRDDAGEDPSGRNPQ